MHQPQLPDTCNNFGFWIPDRMVKVVWLNFYQRIVGLSDIFSGL
jgi:hypothetical protein